MSAIYKDGTWYGKGGSSGGGGHTIEDPEGTALTQRDTLQFGGDLEVFDDSTNEKTVVVPHELTTEELTEIMSTLPGTPMDLPVLFDESGAEYQVGWYKYANGTKKPVYEKSFVYSSIGTMSSASKDVSGLSIDKVINIFGTVISGDGNQILPLNIAHTTSIENQCFIRFDAVNGSPSTLIIYTANHCSISSGLVRVYFTKTTDTPV